jgi:hypothetical protein
MFKGRSHKVAKFRYLGTTITNQNLIQEEIKRRLNTVVNFRVPQNTGKFLSGCTIGSFSGRAQLCN